MVDSGFDDLRDKAFEQFKAEGYDVGVRRRARGDLWRCDVSRDSKPLMTVETNGWRRDMKTTIYASVGQQNFIDIATNYFSSLSGIETASGEPITDEMTGQVRVEADDWGRIMTYTPGATETDPSRIEILVTREKLTSIDIEEVDSSRKVRTEVNRLGPTINKIDGNIPRVIVSNVYELARQELVKPRGIGNTNS